MSNLNSLTIPENLQPVLTFIDTQVHNAVSRNSSLIHFKPENKFENGITVTGTYTIDYQYITSVQRQPTEMRIGFKGEEVCVQLDTTNYAESRGSRHIEEFILTDIIAVKKFLLRLNRKKESYELTDYFARYPLRGGAFAAIKELFIQKLSKDYPGTRLHDFFNSKSVISVVQPVKRPEDQIYQYSFSTEKTSNYLCNVTIVVDFKNQTVLQKTFIDPANTICNKNDYDDATLISLLLKRGFKN
jgi:hypothetical protein